MQKKSTLTLIWGLARQYQVKSITNSTRFKPGEWLDVNVVDECCNDANWDVTMAENDFLEKVISVIPSIISIPMQLPLLKAVPDHPAATWSGDPNNPAGAHGGSLAKG